MGTRNLTMVVHKGKTKVAQYGQWDGYPSGVGLDVLKFAHFIKPKKNFNKFVKKLGNCEFITDEKYSELSEKLIGKTDGWITMEQSAVLKKALASMHRDTGADILPLIFESTGPVYLGNSESFANDSLFCEWAYVLDLDAKTFEVYEGFNKAPLESSERFYNDGVEAEKYYPVKLKKTYDLSDLPEGPQFLKDLKSDEEEE